MSKEESFEKYEYYWDKRGLLVGIFLLLQGVIFILIGLGGLI